MQQFFRFFKLLFKTEITAVEFLDAIAYSLGICVYTIIENWFEKDVRLMLTSSIKFKNLKLYLKAWSQINFLKRLLKSDTLIIQSISILLRLDF